MAARLGFLDCAPCLLIDSQRQIPIQFEVASIRVPDSGPRVNHLNQETLDPGQRIAAEEPVLETLGLGVKGQEADLMLSGCNERSLPDFFAT